MRTYGVLGVGSIGTSIVTGLCSGVDDAPSVLLSPRNTQRSQGLAEAFATVTVADDNQAVVDGSDVIIVCLLPSQAPEALRELSFRSGQGVVSAMAGVSMDALVDLVAPATDLARSIPLPAVAGRSSVTPVWPDGAAAVELYTLLGGAMTVEDEDTFDALSVASGTIAAHFAYLASITDWLERHGVADGDASRYVADMYAALSPELRADDVDLVSLSADHSTPGGLNERFARHLEESGVTDAISSGLDAAFRRVTGG